jgi:hypothetical protein
LIPARLDDVEARPELSMQKRTAAERKLLHEPDIDLFAA